MEYIILGLLIIILIISVIFNFKLYVDDNASIMTMIIVNALSFIFVATILLGNKKVQILHKNQKLNYVIYLNNLG